jgi:ATP-dependent DNA helicase HFM1/MER3
MYCVRVAQDRLQTITSGVEAVESTLHTSLSEHVVSEVALRTVTSLQTGLELLRSTFMYIRMRRSVLMHNSHFMLTVVLSLF